MLSGNFGLKFSSANLLTAYRSGSSRYCRLFVTSSYRIRAKEYTSDCGMGFTTVLFWSFRCSMAVKMLLLEYPVIRDRYFFMLKSPPPPNTACSPSKKTQLGDKLPWTRPAS